MDESPIEHVCKFAQALHPLVCETSIQKDTGCKPVTLRDPTLQPKWIKWEYRACFFVIETWQGLTGAWRKTQFSAGNQRNGCFSDLLVAINCFVFHQTTADDGSVHQYTSYHFIKSTRHDSERASERASDATEKRKTSQRLNKRLQSKQKTCHRLFSVDVTRYRICNHMLEVSIWH